MEKFTETVRNSADIIRVVSDYVSLKGTGNTLKGLCPFHSEKTPSFTVHRDKQFFHCFGCGVGGDVFSFVKLTEKVSFPESVRIVAEKFGIPVPANTGLDDQKSEERLRLFEIYDRAAAYFQQMLPTEEAAAARQVLEKRKIQPAFIERFRLGFAPGNGLARSLRLTAGKDQVESGLFIQNDRGEVYERFRRRLIFPIWNERGKPIAFGGRALAADAQPKYLNSAESPLYQKSYVLYALHLARDAAQKAGRIVVVEGYFDCLSLHQAGIENVAASCGTSLTAQQVATMARYVPEVVMNYDPDSAGQNAMRRSIDLLLAKGLRVRILKLGGGLDPDDFVRKEGPEVYNRLLAAAPHFWQYLMNEAARQNDLDQPSAKAAAVSEVMQHVAKIQDRVEQLEVAREVAEGFKVPESLILEKLKISPGKKAVGAAYDRPGAHRAPLQEERKLTLAEKQLIHALVQRRDVAEDLQAYLREDFGSSVWSRPVLEELIKDPGRNVETILEHVDDEDLKRQVFAAWGEDFGSVSRDEALSSIKQLYGQYLVQKREEIREKLKQSASPADQKELTKRFTDLVAQISRVGALKA